ncbi:hypothetical protein VU10_06430 [Desulfobulbus sp. US1]|nr:hypothetical protein [Desulfobulbus sp. US1]WLE95313.1 MAG: hypothetical protein QTN59_11540 [Candidatus Electrothrix communis]
MTFLEKEGVVVKELTSQGKNAILNRELAAFELEVLNWKKSCTPSGWCSRETSIPYLFF